MYILIGSIKYEQFVWCVWWAEDFDFITQNQYKIHFLEKKWMENIFCNDFYSIDLWIFYLLLFINDQKK